MLAELGFARHYHFLHVRTPARIVEESQSDAQVQHYLERSVNEAFASTTRDVSASCHVVTGVRVDSILEFITLHRCDMALLGHRRARSGQRSLARRLAMIAPCSVWLVPEGAPVSITGVMVPIDFSDHAADSVTVATSIARAAGLADCLAVHVFSDPSMIRYDERIDEIRQNEQQAFEDFIAPIDRHGVEVHPAYVEGNNVAGTLLHAATKHGSDLLVLNTRGRSRSASILLGSVTSQVMVESPIAVLALKHFGAMMNLFQALQQSQMWTRPNPHTN
jgi:nucleotide-binding universal stress UspA family protein